MTEAQQQAVAALKAQGGEWAGWFGRCVRVWMAADDCTKIIAPDGTTTAWS